MRVFQAWMTLLLFGSAILCLTEARRIRVQVPQDEEEQEETVNYYAAEPQEEQGQVVLVSSADRYNGLYGQPSPSSRASQADNYIPRGPAKQHTSARTKESAKPPPVQTIRNYNKVNDDGSFTFGYEAADGSFKEETRGTDCVVRGKYGYVDPDGNKREFTYVSGNPCDPNAPKEEEQEESNEADSDANIPANYPTRPIQPIRRPIATPAPKPAVTLFQNNYAQEEEEQPEPEQLLSRVTPQPSRRPYVSRPQYIQQADDDAQIYQRTSPTTTPASVIYKSSLYPVNITPRPVSVTSAASPRNQLPATTYRPQLLQVSVTPRPVLYTKPPYSLSSPSSTLSPNKNVDFESEFQRFQQENNIVSPTPSAAVAAKAPTTKPKAPPNGNQIYSAALVYDPSTGQYTNQLYQSLPQTDGDFLLKQRIQPYVHQPRTQVLNIQQLQQQSPLYSQNLRPQPIASQTAYQAQHAELQFQNSAQLYAQQQQQRARAQQEQQQQHQQRQPARQQQPLYYVQPSVDSTGALATSQIDAFLRGHNIQFK